MNTARVPPALRERLGIHATDALVQLLDNAKREWAADVMTTVGERFERRLSEEAAKIRIEMAHGFASLRQQMAELRASLRQEMTEGLALLRQEMIEANASLRQEMTEANASLRREITEANASLRREITEGHTSLRQEMAEGFASLRQEMAQQRFELLKWAFLFWVGQFVAMASLVALLFRTLRPGI